MDKVLIIAEAGVNYNGNLKLACKMVDAAKKAGADIIKFQTARPENVISRYAEKAEYQKAATGNGESQLDMVKKLLLKYEEFIPLKEYCQKTGIGFLSTPFDLESIDFLEGLGCNFWKIPSGEITNLPYLLRIARTGKPVIMSTGMCYLEEIKQTLDILKENGSCVLTLLHCTTEYPTPLKDVNLKAMLTLKEKFDCKVGYSDHTPGIEIPTAAAAMGASVIEKHFTLSRNMEGPDQKASLEPDELRTMVTAIRNIELALGNGKKEPAGSEMKNMPIARKSIIAKRNIKAGEILAEENITTKRPGSGISPMEWFHVIGTRAVRDFAEDEMIEL